MNVLYLTFYFEPDIGPGAFRNAAIVEELSRQLTSDSHIHVITTQPNRYESFKPTAPQLEERNHNGCRVTIERVAVPAHASGQLRQIRAFLVYFRAAHRLAEKGNYDLVVASSSRLFTAFLGACLARTHYLPLFLDIRDLFREAILDIHRNLLIRAVLNPALQRVERYTFGYASHINLVSEGFQSYFKRYDKATYSFFTNGIDDEFLNVPTRQPSKAVSPYTLLYAGNIGEGQGLHTIIPLAARRLGPAYRFVIIGEGGARKKLVKAIQAERVTNVQIRPPMSRAELVVAYQKADYLFVHLNDLSAFRRTLPSKLFEYGAMDKPIVAGVVGYAAEFVGKVLTNHILFNPGDVDSLVRQLHETPYTTQPRDNFVAQFGRRAMSQGIARQVLQLMPEPLKTNVTSELVKPPIPSL